MAANRFNFVEGKKLVKTMLESLARASEYKPNGIFLADNGLRLIQNLFVALVLKVTTRFFACLFSCIISKL